MSFSPLKAALKNHSDLDQKRIKAAYDLAECTHAGQSRLSGNPYIEHPVAVSLLILEAGGDEDMICAALLHDCIEDAENPIQVAGDISNQFGSHIYFLVEALSKNKKIIESQIRHSDFIEQLDMAFKTDVGVFFIKLADLLHNLESIELLKPEKKAKWLRELQEDYLPVLSDYFHELSFHYHPMYHHLMDQFEDIVSQKI